MKKVRILWLSCTPSCFDIKLNGGWVESLEKIVKAYLPEIELGIVFEHPHEEFKVIQNGVVYYPVNIQRNKFYPVSKLFFSSVKSDYDALRPKYLKAINDFNPDLVQCFGTELWHYSLLQKEVSVPFVVHMMGFWHIIKETNDIVNSSSSIFDYLSPIRILKKYKSHISSQEHLALEMETMSVIKYFMGRTEWDKQIIHHFSPQAKYFYCSEALREEFYTSATSWSYKEDDIIRLITVSNAGKLKGNEIILRTAHILKKCFNKKVHWIYTSSRELMKEYENKVGVKCKDVGIDLVGRLSPANLIDVLVSAQMFVHPSAIENSSNAVCEAQLLGVPVISSNVGGMAQIVDDQYSGVLYPYNEPYALAFRILEMHNNEERLTALSSNEKLISHQRHNPKMIADNILSIYMDIINDQK
ncbi:MAG: glycosyltransferase [Bacteroidales bacterium]|nr:glycosyltransferase [Bacteroidales bacterium]